MYSPNELVDHFPEYLKFAILMTCKLRLPMPHALPLS